MRTILILIFIIWCLGCTRKTAKKANSIDVVGYSFKFPQDFRLVEGEHIDAAVGEVKGDSFSISYGASNAIYPLIQSPQEFIKSGTWKFEAFTKFMKPSRSYSSEDIRRIKLLQARLATAQDSFRFPQADYICLCSLDTVVFEYGIVLPKEIKAHSFKTDTVHNHYRKVVTAKDPSKGETGLYLKDLSSCKDEYNCFALSMVAEDLTKAQQEQVLQIYTTVKMKK